MTKASQINTHEKRDAQKLFITYLPANCLENRDIRLKNRKQRKQWGSPKNIAAQVNPPMERFIQGVGDQKIGIVVFDYPYQSLILEVLNKNQRLIRP